MTAKLNYITTENFCSSKIPQIEKKTKTKKSLGLGELCALLLTAIESVTRTYKTPAE